MREVIQLKSTTARAARSEAKAYAPCDIKGYAGDECVFMSTIREPGNKAYVATATMNRGPKATRFEAIRK